LSAKGKISEKQKIFLQDFIQNEQCERSVLRKTATSFGLLDMPCNKIPKKQFQFISVGGNPVFIQTHFVL
jgi:hypothetical protein